MTKKLWISISSIIIVAALFAAFIYRSTNKGVTYDENRLVVVSPHPTEFMIPLIQEFENETGIAVELISCGTTEAIDSIMNNADIDVLWGGSLLAVGPYKDCFYAYKTLNRAVFMEEYKNAEDEFTCFSNVPSVLMVNKDIIGDVEINGYGDLLQDELKGQIAFANPEKSSSAFEHLVNMLYDMGDGNPDKGWDYVKEFVKNLDGVLLDNSSAVYKGVANGEFNVGLTFEEAAVTMLKSDKHIEIIYMTEG
ncbi:MAG: extracellular solute-binding protein, partial [Butyrivibrio sp.]|nr:extracellular solute-binding protein [Butyrivibrio sp.]